MALRSFPVYRKMTPLETLLYMKSLVFSLINEYFPKNRELAEFVQKRFEGAEDILRHRSGSIHIHKGFVVGEIEPSEKSTSLPAGTYVNLAGEKVSIEPDEGIGYQVVVGEFSMKCNCDDARRTVRKAKMVLNTMARKRKLRPRVSFEPVRYILCKHTLALLSVAVSEGIIPLSDNLMRTVLSSLLVAYLAAKEHPDEHTVARVLSRVGSSAKPSTRL